MDHIGPAVASSNSITSLNIANNCVGWNGGVEKVVQMLTDNGALTKLDISNNNIQQGEALQGITDLCNIKGIVMSRTQIPSGY